MSYELFNGYELFPHRPDWSRPPEHSFRWETRVVAAADGSEHRSAVRSQRRAGVRFGVAPYDLAEAMVLRARLIEIDKVGKAAVPFWGRGLRTTSATGDTIVLDEEPATPPEAGDLMLICRWEVEHWQVYDAVEVESVAGDTVTLTAPMANTYPEGCFLYPLLTGPFTHGELPAESNWTPTVEVEVIESQNNPAPVDTYQLVGMARAIAAGQDDFDRTQRVGMARVIVIGMDNLPT